MHCNGELNLGDIFLSQGDNATAKVFFEKTHQLTNKPSTSDWMRWRYSQHLFAGLAELCLKSDNPKKAESYCSQLLELATRSNSKKYLVRGWRIKAEIEMARLNWDDVETALNKALPMAEAIGNPTQLWKTQVAFSHHCRETRQVEQAKQHDNAALSVIEQMTKRVKSPELRTSWKTSSLYEPVRELG